MSTTSILYGSVGGGTPLKKRQTIVFSEIPINKIDLKFIFNKTIIGYLFVIFMRYQFYR